MFFIKHEIQYESKAQVSVCVCVCGGGAYLPGMLPFVFGDIILFLNLFFIIISLCEISTQYFMLFILPYVKLDFFP